MVKAVRGATTVEHNDENEIINESKKLLEEIVDKNSIAKEDIISVFFTVTNDLDATFPAKAARKLGWTLIPLIDLVQYNTTDGLKRCIRVLIHINSDKTHEQIKHIYLNKAIKLRPDLIE